MKDRRHHPPVSSKSKNRWETNNECIVCLILPMPNRFSRPLHPTVPLRSQWRRSVRDLHGHTVLRKEPNKRLLGQHSKLKLSEDVMSALHYLQGVVRSYMSVKCDVLHWAGFELRSQATGEQKYIETRILTEAMTAKSYGHALFRPANGILAPCLKNSNYISLRFPFCMKGTLNARKERTCRSVNSEFTYAHLVCVTLVRTNRRRRCRIDARTSQREEVVEASNTGL